MDNLFKTFSSKPPSISIFIEPSGHPNTFLKSPINNSVMEYPTFHSKDPIKGRVQIDLNNNRNFRHSGIKIELIGLIENYRDINLSSKFISLTNDLSQPGSNLNNISFFDFYFGSIDKQHETYKGKLMGIKFILQVTIQTPYKPQTEETEIVILNPISSHEFFTKPNPPLKVEIGVENLLHVCFELEKTNYHLKDVIKGRVYFKNLEVELRSMEIQIIKKENSQQKEGENEIMGIFEIMDGSPSSTEDIIPIRMFLRGYRNLTPSIKNVNGKFEVNYYVNLEIADVEDRRFFKRMEVNFSRMEDSYYERKKKGKDVEEETNNKNKQKEFGFIFNKTEQSNDEKAIQKNMQKISAMFQDD